MVTAAFGRPGYWFLTFAQFLFPFFGTHIQEVAPHTPLVLCCCALPLLSNGWLCGDHWRHIQQDIETNWSGFSPSLPFPHAHTHTHTHTILTHTQNHTHTNTHSHAHTHTHTHTILTHTHVLPPLPAPGAPDIVYDEVLIKAVMVVAVMMPISMLRNIARLEKVDHVMTPVLWSVCRLPN